MTYVFLDRALLEQRQVLGLPTYKGDKKSDKKRDKNSSGRNEEDLVSLDHCTCPPDCPPKGINKVFTVPPRPDKDPSYETKSNLEKAKAWIKELQRQANENIVIALAGNKSDLEDRRAVDTAVCARVDIRD